MWVISFYRNRIQGILGRSKISSKSYTAPDGSKFEIQAYRNAITGQVAEPKSVK
jgi:hypothetical protein